MHIRNIFAWGCCRLGWLLLSVIRCLVLGAMFVAAALLMFILAGQLKRFGWSGEWHPVPNAEMLEIMNIDVSTLAEPEFGSLIRPLIDAPATLCLAVVVAAMLIIMWSTRGLERKLRFYDPHGARRKAMIKAIEGNSQGRANV